MEFKILILGKYEPKNFITKWKGNCVILVFRIDGVENMHGHNNCYGSICHLHIYTSIQSISLLDGSSKIKEITKRAAELGMDSLAITDHGVMYGVIDFYRAAKDAGIKPILGCEVYVAPGSRFDKEAGTGDDKYNHLVLLAENNKGYQNLMKIVSRGFTEGFYYKPRVDKEVLRQFGEGIIASSACLAGEVQRYLTRGMYEEAKRVALEYQGHIWQGQFLF